MRARFRKNVAALAGYMPGEQPQDGGYVKLNTNENPYPPSPRVRLAVAAEASRLRLYPSPDAAALRAQAAATYGIDRSRIIAGNGSDDLLAIVARAFIGEGDALCC